MIKKVFLTFVVMVSLMIGVTGFEMARLSQLANPEIADEAGWTTMRRIVEREYPLLEYKRGGLLPVSEKPVPSSRSQTNALGTNTVSIQLLENKPWRLKWGSGMLSLAFDVGWTPIVQAQGKKEKVVFTFHDSWITRLPLEKWGIDIVRKPFLKDTSVCIFQ